MARNRYSSTRRIRPGVALAVIALHVVVAAGLVRAFAPDFVGSVVQSVTSTLTVTITTPTPTPEPTPEKPAPNSRAPEEEGAAAPPGKKARPREVTAPEAKVVIADTPAPRASSTGTENRSGAADAGEGTGLAGQGQGTGSGQSGSGQGGGGGSRAVKISGEISSARDYPRETRDLRIGQSVILALTVGTDGRVKGCRIHRASPDPEADRITCQLATERFRFKPATDAAGNPVVSTFGWQQRWFYPGKT